MALPGVQGAYHNGSEEVSLWGSSQRRRPGNRAGDGSGAHSPQEGGETVDDTLEKPREALSEVDRAVAEICQRQDWVKRQMKRMDPSMLDEALGEAARRDPSMVLVKAIVDLRRQVWGLLQEIESEREDCARIDEEYTAPKRFAAAKDWKGKLSPSKVYETAVVDVGGYPPRFSRS